LVIFFIVITTYSAKALTVLKIVQIFNDSSEVNQYCIITLLRPATQVRVPLFTQTFMPFATAFKSTKNQQHFHR
jgi:hypothetical protein